MKICLKNDLCPLSVLNLRKQVCATVSANGWPIACEQAHLFEEFARLSCATILAAKAAICESSFAICESSFATRPIPLAGSLRSPTHKWRLSPPR